MNGVLWQIFSGTCLAGVLAIGAWIRMVINRNRRRRRAIDKDVADVKTALLGTHGRSEYGLEPVAGLVETIEQLRVCIQQMEQRLGHNGGSTVFDGLASLQKDHQKLTKWAKDHTDTSNLQMSELSEVLKDLGVSWNPVVRNQFTPPR